LQQLELEIDSLESQAAAADARIRDNREVDEASSKLEAAQSRLEELKKRQQSLDWEIEDIGGKLAKESEALYSGRIKNPKELTGLQHEVDALKEKKNGLEDEDLELMEQMEKAESDVSALGQELESLKAEWQGRKKVLSAELESLRASLDGLNADREQALASIGPQAAAMYSELKKQKGRAVAVVEQGVCRGCGLSLSSAWLQRARAELVRCSSCGRFLYLE
jgi:predicted  nucleic acid-binding Zn-ribbon protein